MSPSVAVSVFWPRLVLGSLLFLSLFLPSVLQPGISRLWTYLYHASWYRFSGIETVETISCYIVIELCYTYKFGKNPQLRIDMRGPTRTQPATGKPKLPKMRRPSKRLGEILTYVAPLLTMDFIMIKKFAGVPVSSIRQSGGYPSLPPTANDTLSPYFLKPTLHNFTWSSPFQLHRAVPLTPPTSRRLVLELLIAFFIYDALFFFIHIAFHRLPPLARIHLPHHTHSEMHPQVTNRLSVPERLALILLANFALNIIGSHVLTRTAFVPVFVYLLIEVHSGMDLPWGYDKILPFGLGAGSKAHAVHHRTGEGAFQPFFTWWDNGLEWAEGKKGRGRFGARSI